MSPHALQPIRRITPTIRTSRQTIAPTLIIYRHTMRVFLYMLSQNTNKLNTRERRTHDGVNTYGRHDMRGEGLWEVLKFATKATIIIIALEHLLG